MSLSKMTHPDWSPDFKAIGLQKKAMDAKYGNWNGTTAPVMSEIKEETDKALSSAKQNIKK